MKTKIGVIRNNRGPCRPSLEQRTGHGWHWDAGAELFYFGSSLPLSVASMTSDINDGHRWAAHPDGHGSTEVASGYDTDLGDAMEAACQAAHLAMFGDVVEA